LGYLVHEPSGMTGNYGIGDLISALKFIKPLLPSFGGDPNRITLMGQSSGGTNILALLAAEQSVGLFQGVISLSGSPNITMSVADTTMYHRKYILPAVGCDVPDPQVKACLLSRSAKNLTDGMNVITGAPPTVNPPILPFSPQGNFLIGLSIVDGVIVKRPLLDALSVPVVDVPFIVQSTQAELELSDEDVDKMTKLSDYANWLNNYLSKNGWSNSSGISSRVLELYKTELGITIELGFEAFVTDLSTICGNDIVAEISAKHFRSPVYRTHVNTPPSHSLNGKHYAFHTWDCPIAGVQAWGGWTPQASDIALGASLRKTWHDFMYNGKLSPEFKEGGCTAYGPSGVPGNCEISKCQQIENELGFGMSFWWAN